MSGWVLSRFPIALGMDWVPASGHHLAAAPFPPDPRRAPLETFGAQQAHGGHAACPERTRQETRLSWTLKSLTHALNRVLCASDAPMPGDFLFPTKLCQGRAASSTSLFLELLCNLRLQGKSPQRSTPRLEQTSKANPRIPTE